MAWWLSPWYDEMTSAAGPIISQLALVDPGRVLAELLDLAEPVADEHDRAAVAPELLDLLGAARWKLSSPTESTSSISSTSGSTLAATAKPRRTNMPDE